MSALEANIYVLGRVTNETGLKILQTHDKKKSPIVKVKKLKTFERALTLWEEEMTELLTKELIHKEVDYNSTDQQGCPHNVFKEMNRLIFDIRDKCQEHLSFKFHDTTLDNLERLLKPSEIHQVGDQRRDVPSTMFTRFKQWRKSVMSMHYKVLRENIPVTYYVPCIDSNALIEKTIYVENYLLTPTLSEVYLNHYLRSSLDVRKLLRLILTFQLTPVLYVSEIKQNIFLTDLPLYVRFDNFFDSK